MPGSLIKPLAQAGLTGGGWRNNGHWSHARQRYIHGVVGEAERGVRAGVVGAVVGTQDKLRRQ